MKRLALPIAVATSLALALGPTGALADERPYAFTYEPVTDAQGETELELYETYYRPPGGGDDGRKFVHQLEIGYGLTDRLDVALYTVAGSTTADPFRLEAFKLRGRYKLLDQASAPLSLVLYLEGEKEIVDDKPWALEEKIIFGRDFGRLGFAINLIAEQEFVGGEVEKEWGWSAGAAATVVDGFRLGAESFGAVKRSGGVTEKEAWAGPTGVVALPFLRHGFVNSAWLTVGVGFGLTDASDDVRARALVGIDF